MPATIFSQTITYFIIHDYSNFLSCFWGGWLFNYSFFSKSSVNLGVRTCGVEMCSGLQELDEIQLCLPKCH